MICVYGLNIEIKKALSETVVIHGFLFVQWQHYRMACFHSSEYLSPLRISPG